MISGNDGHGIALVGSGTTGNRIEGNFIGTNAADDVLDNNGSGVRFNGASSNTVGGTAIGAGNVIAYNIGFGVEVFSGTGNAILGNSIHDNESPGIEISAGANDPLDADTGPNQLQNWPALGSAFLDPMYGAVTLAGTLASTPNTTFRLEFFRTAAAGDGESFLTFVNVTTDGSGNAPFSAMAGSLTLGSFVTATATDPAGNTSEFSALATVAEGTTATVSIGDVSLIEGDSGTVTAVFTVTLSEPVALPVSVNFATADGTADAASGDYQA